MTVPNSTIPNEGYYYLACDDGIRQLSVQSDGSYAIDMLSTLLDPTKSVFVHNAHTFFANHNGIASTFFFDTQWYFSQTGEPHLITFAALSTDSLILQGMSLNNSYRHLFPGGISLNLVHIIDKGILSVTTFERGVLRITASCGSGSTSAAVLAYKLGLLKSSHMQVITSGGKLEIIFKDDRSLKIGPATIELSNPSFIYLETYHE